MISVEEAKRIMMERVVPLPDHEVALPEAIDHFCARPIAAPVDHPLFDMSAVDGYAFAFGEAQKDWQVVASIAAGEVLSRTLRDNECARIFTGARIPAGADTVVMQELAMLNDDRMSHTDQRLRKGGNVRRTGEQARAGDRLLDLGDLLSAPAIGLLASFGIARVNVATQPRVCTVITGNEFANNAEAGPGQIFNSNGVMLRTALSKHAAEVFSERATDDKQALYKAIERAIAMGHLIVTTGGASVGEHDLVAAVLAEFGAMIHFHGVAQKPGKPMLFATINGKPIFSLPGNPRAVMVLVWEYVLPFMRAMQGAKDPWPKTDALPVSAPVNVKGERAEFRAAATKNGEVSLLADEGSHMLRSLVDADAVAYLPAGKRSWSKGEPMEVHYLPR